MINRFEKFTFFIEELAKLLHKISADEMEFFGLKGPYAVYLFMIADNPEGITAAAISERCGRDKADVSRAIGAMVERGLVERKASSGRNYRTPIVLTDEGRAAVTKLREKAKSAVEYASHNVSEADREKLYDTLEVIYENLVTMSKTGVPGGNGAVD